MNKTTKRLGRGLDSLVSNLVGLASSEPEKFESQQTEHHLAGDRSPTLLAPSAEVPINLLTPNPYQPRRKIDPKDLQQLADSLLVNGMINPITVRRTSSGYQIIAGERRWQAALLAELQTVPISIKDADDRQMHELALVENIQREDLNAIDRARAYQEYGQTYHATAEEIARRLGENRTTVTNYVRLLDLPDEVQSMVADGQLSMGHARCILGLQEGRERIHFAKKAVAEALSVRALEDMVRIAKSPRELTSVNKTAAGTPSEKTKSPHLNDLEERFSTALGTRVNIHEGRNKNTGRIIIEYYSLSDFDRLASAMGINLDA